MSPVAFYHCYQQGPWERITLELFQHFSSPGTESLKTVLVSLVGEANFRQILETWALPCVISRMPGGNEIVTLNLLWRYAKENDGPVLYFHSKGVTKSSIEAHMRCWRDYMSYFLIENMPRCLGHLAEGADAVGVDYRFGDYRRNPEPHFSGNFWWTTCKHLRTLEQPTHAPEMWVCSRDGGNYHSLHDSKENLYHRIYPRSSYEGKFS